MSDAFAPGAEDQRAMFFVTIQNEVCEAQRLALDLVQARWLLSTTLGLCLPRVASGTPWARVAIKVSKK